MSGDGGDDPMDDLKLAYDLYADEQTGQISVSNAVRSCSSSRRSLEQCTFPTQQQRARAGGTAPSGWTPSFEDVQREELLYHVQGQTSLEMTQKK